MANQIIIDIGAVANDGTGDPLRTAFGYVNNNFSNIWATGVANSNISFSGNRILTTNTNGNLILAPNGIGKVQANVDIVPNANNTLNLGSLTNKWNTVYAQNLDVNGTLSSGDLTVDGNLTVSGNIIQIGNLVTDAKTIQLSNTASTANAANGSGITVGANDNIATILYSSTSNVWTTNIGITATGNITGSYFIGNGALLTGITSYGNANVAAYLPTYNGNISAAYINVANNVNVQNDVFAKRGTFTGDPVTGDASMYVGSPTFTVLGTDVMAQFTGNVTNYAQLNLQNYGNSPTASGDYIITADNGTDSTHFLNLGLTGSNWDGTQPNSLGNRLGPNDGYLYVQDGDFVLGTSNGNIETWKFDQTGTMTVPGDILPVANNIQSLGSATNQWNDLYISNATIFMNGVPISLGAGNVLTVNGEAVLSNDSNATITTTGNITADYFFGNGSQLTGISQYGNANVAAYLPTYTGNISAGNAFVTNTISSQDAFITRGTFSGDPVTGDASLYVGSPSFTNLGSDVMAQFTGNVTNYAQINLQNYGNAPTASGDYIVTADNGTDSTHFINMGITSSTWDGSQTNSLGNNLSANDGYLYVQDGNLVVGTVNGTINAWKFGIDGNLNLPLNGNIVGTTPNNSGHLQWVGNSSGDGGGYTTLRLIPDDTRENSDQYLIIDPTAPGHIHIRAGGTQDASSADLFLGGENSYFKVASGANTEVQVTSNSNTWVFNTDGNLQVPGNINGDNSAPLFIDGASSGEGFIRLPSASFGGEQVAIVNQFSLGNGIALTTNGGTWHFDNTGDLTAPGNISGNTAGYAIGYRDIPQVSFTGNATIATTDAGKHFYSTQSSNYILTIANNASQGFQVGAAITVVNQGTGTITIAQDSGVTLYIAGNATPGNRSVSTFGMATIMKVATDTWFINGTGVS